MLLARLVTGRYGYEGVVEQPRSHSVPASQGWFSRLVAMLSVRKKAGS